MLFGTPQTAAELRGIEGKAEKRNYRSDRARSGVLRSGALGFDMLAEETVLQLKEDYPHIRLVLVLPCPPEQQTLKWRADQRQRYYEILERADKVRILSPQYTNDCMLARNRHLVDGSAYLICYLREQRGGTAYTVRYAREQGLEIIQL